MSSKLQKPFFELSKIFRISDFSDLVYSTELLKRENIIIKFLLLKFLFLKFLSTKHLSSKANLGQLIQLRWRFLSQNLMTLSRQLLSQRTSP